MRNGLVRGLFAGCMGLAVVAAEATAKAQTITVDAADVVSGNPRFWSACVGTGTASLSLRSDLQTHYKLANRELGMERVRGHGILNEEMGVYQLSGGAPTYDWTNYDTYLAAIEAANMHPIIELSFMPHDLAAQGESINPPNDLAAYSDFIEAVVQHTVDLYGEEEVSQWYWEVWNEPNYEGFWTGTMDDYLAMYDAAVAGATRALPEILIGGPVTTQASSTEIQAFLAHARDNNTRVTFVSSHAYPGGEGETANAGFGVNDNDARRAAMQAEGFGDLLSMNTEWNTAYTGQGGNMTPNNVSMDNHANAPFILKSVKLLADQNQGDTPPLAVFSYWAVSDVFGEYNGLIHGGSYIEEQGGGTLPFGSVFGLLTYQGMRKAAFNAFKMLNYLGDGLISVSGGSGNSDGVDAMASVSADGDEVAVIVYNYYETINTAGSDEVTVNVENLPFAGQEVFLTQFAIDEDHSNPYSVWTSLGQPNAPSEEQWQAMRAAQHLALLEPVTTLTAADTFSTTLTLPRQGAAMILLSLERPVTGRDALMEIEAEDYDGQAGATRQDSGDTSMGQSIAAGDGATVFFHNVDFSDAGVNSVELRVNAQAAATLELREDSADGALLGTCDIAATGGDWATQTCALAETSGAHTLYALFGGTMRLNWMMFKQGEGAVGTGGAGGMSAGGNGGVPGGGMTATGGMTAAGGMEGMSGGMTGMPVGGNTSAGGAAPGGEPPGGGAAAGVPADTPATAAGSGTVPVTPGAADPGGSAAGGGTSSPAGSGSGGPTNGDAGSGGSSCGCRLASDRPAPLGLGLLGLLSFALRRQRRRVHPRPFAPTHL